MGTIESFLTHYDTAVSVTTRWHGQWTGNLGLFHFNPAIRDWVQLSHESRIEALNRIRERRIHGRPRAVSFRFFLALRQAGHDIKPYKEFWNNTEHTRFITGDY